MTPQTTAVPNALESLVVAQVARMHHDKCVLESLYRQLPPKDSASPIDMRFLYLLADLEGQAERLERTLSMMDGGANV
jgi:hypothetical protein